jgi:hypothetical protein
VLVKSPVELVVGSLRQFELAPDQTLPFALVAAGMGQNLFAPPNVKGWPGAETWINTTTLLARKQFLDRLTRADDVMAVPMAPRAAAPSDLPDDAKVRQQRLRVVIERGLASLRFDSKRWLAALPGEAPEERAQAAQRLLFAVAPLQAPDASADPLTLVRGFVQDAAYQLK